MLTCFHASMASGETPDGPPLPKHARSPLATSLFSGLGFGINATLSLASTATATRSFTTEHSRSCISVAQSAMLLPFGMCSARPDRKPEVHRQCWHTYARRTHGVVSGTPLLRTRRCSGFVIRRSGLCKSEKQPRKRSPRSFEGGSHRQSSRNMFQMNSPTS